MPRGKRWGPTAQALTVLALAGSVLVALALQRSARLERRDSAGRTPLQNAANAGDHADMRRLLGAGADPDSQHEVRFLQLRRALHLPERRVQRVSPLEICAWECDAIGTELLLEAGADELGHAATTAIELNCEPVLRLLVRASPIPGQSVTRREGPMTIAVRDGRPRLAALLLEGGQDPNGVAGQRGMGHLPAAMSHCTTTTWSLTFAYSGPYRRNQPGSLPPASREELYDLVATLVDHGAALDAADPTWGLRPLDWAEQVCDSPTMRGVLERAGASKRGGADAAVRAALLTGHRLKLRKALEAGGRADQSLPDGRSMLQWAAGNAPLEELIRDALVTQARASASSGP